MPQAQLPRHQTAAAASEDPGSDAARPSRRGPYRKTAARQQEILDAALAVFGRSGYRSGSIREIADTVGMSQAGLLHHFESKDALLTAVLRHRDERSRRLFSRARGIDFLVSAVDAFRVTERGTAELYCVLSAEATAPGHPAHDYFTERYDWLRSVLTDAFGRMASARQLRAGVDPAAAARSTVAVMDGLQLQWLLDPASVDMAADLSAHFRALATDEAWQAALATRMRSGEMDSVQ
jgi:AcrR family transcriptional regulator